MASFLYKTRSNTVILINSYCKFRSLSQGFSSISTFLFANINLQNESFLLFVWFFKSAIIKPPTSFPSHICRCVYICLLSYFPRTGLHTISKNVLGFIFIFSEKGKNLQKGKKYPAKFTNIQITAHKLKTALRLLGNKLMPEIIPQVHMIHRVMPNLQTDHETKQVLTFHYLFLILVTHFSQLKYECITSLNNIFLY